jgi:type I restriction enzyme M protein
MTREELKELESRLWAAADNLRANSDLKASEYVTPVLGLIFLRFADNNYRRREPEIIAEYEKLKGTRRRSAAVRPPSGRVCFFPRAPWAKPHGYVRLPAGRRMLRPPRSPVVPATCRPPLRAARWR